MTPREVGDQPCAPTASCPVPLPALWAVPAVLHGPAAPRRQWGLEASRKFLRQVSRRGPCWACGSTVLTGSFSPPPVLGRGDSFTAASKEEATSCHRACAPHQDSWPPPSRSALCARRTPRPQRFKKAQVFHCFYLLLVTTRG